MNKLQKIPVVGDVVEDFGFKFLVEETVDNRVEKVKIEKIK